MKQLFLDTSSHNLVIALYEDSKKIYELIEDANNKVSSTLLVKIDEVLKKCNLEIKDIDEIYAVNGPGSFTGVRIGLTFAKVTAYSLNKKVVPISELELLSSTTNTKYVVSLIDARRGFAYAGMYDKDLNSIIADKYVNVEEYIKELESNYNMDDITFVSYDSFEHINVLEPKLDIEKVIFKHKNDCGINPHKLNPNYLKKTEAEERLNDKKSN